MEQKLRKTGIDIIGDAHWGTHFCQFYQTKEDLIDILVPYFKAGLENNEYCMWVTSEPLKLEEAKAALRKEVKNLDNYIKKGQIEILDYSNWYIKSGRFESYKVLEGWVKKEKEALKRGFEGLRLTGNTFWLEKRDWKSFADYEAVVDSVIGEYRMLAICSYSLDKCKGGEIIDVLSNHQFALIKRAGKWEIIESSGRKKTKEGLQVTTSILQNIISNIPYYVFWKDKNSVYLGCNDNFAKLAGVEKPEAIIGKTDYDLPWKKEESDFYRKIDKEVMSKVTPILNIEESAHWTDGKVATILTSKVPLRNAYGEVTGILGIFTDITERVKTEEKQRQVADEWKTTFDSITDMVSIHDKDFKIIRANRSFASAFNKIKPDEIIGKTCYELIHGKKEPPPFCPHKRTLNTGKPNRKEFFEPRLGIHIEASTSPLFDENGQTIASVHIAKDITERKQAEAELKAAQEKLIDTARTAGMAEVAADMLHNVGNVLNSINVSATVIREKVTKSELANLEKVANIINEHTDDLGTFLTEHPQGKHIPVYLTEVS
ncbi:MAG: MEDS domain-containing protein, partial [Sedimentisphaerales bacterium]